VGAADLDLPIVGTTTPLKKITVCVSTPAEKVFVSALKGRIGVTINHSVYTLQVPPRDVDGHIDHGDEPGPYVSGDRCVCHTRPPEPITLCLPAPAIEAHLRHGDTAGPCPEE
jgi:hypothetical protein